MKKSRIFLTGLLLICSLGLFTGCGNVGDSVTDDTDKNTTSESDRQENTGKSDSVGNDIEDAGKEALDGVKDTGEAVLDGVKDTGDAVLDGVEDVTDPDQNSADTKNNQTSDQNSADTKNNQASDQKTTDTKNNSSSVKNTTD